MRAAIEALERLVRTLKGAPWPSVCALLVGAVVYQEMGKQELQRSKDDRVTELLGKIDTLTSKVIREQEDKIELQGEVLRLTEKDKQAAQQRVNELLNR